MAWQADQLHACFFRIRKSPAESRICFLIPPYFLNAVHLNHKQKDGMISDCVCQFLKMPCSPHGRSIREIADSFPLQRASLDFHQEPLITPYHHKIQTGLTVTVFRPDQIETPGIQPFSCDCIRSLAVNIDQQAVLFFNSKQIISCFSGRTGGSGKPDTGSGQQQFPAASCILYMHCFHQAADSHMGDKPVRPVDKRCGNNIAVSHVFMCFRGRIPGAKVTASPRGRPLPARIQYLTAVSIYIRFLILFLHYRRSEA